MNKFLSFFILITFLPCLCFAQTLQGIEVYEISALKGQQIYYASHIKASHIKSSKLMDDEDRAAVLGAMGKTGIAMPRLPDPYIDNECNVQPSKINIQTFKDKNGEVLQIAKIEYKGGEDSYIVTRSENDDTINCILLGEGVVQVYTIHLNVTFPDGSKLITMQTTRNRALGVSTMCVSGKATRLK